MLEVTVEQWKREGFAAGSKEGRAKGLAKGRTETSKAVFD